MWPNIISGSLGSHAYSEGEKTIRRGWGDATRDTVRYFKSKKRPEACFQLIKMDERYSHTDV